MMGFGFVLDGSCYCSGVNGCQLGFVPWLSLRMFLQCESTKGTHSLLGLEACEDRENVSPTAGNNVVCSHSTRSCEQR